MTAADIRSSRFWVGFFNLYSDLHWFTQYSEKQAAGQALKQWSAGKKDDSGMVRLSENSSNFF